MEAEGKRTIVERDSLEDHEGHILQSSEAVNEEEVAT